jgi:hypothetical protein
VRRDIVDWTRHVQIGWVLCGHDFNSPFPGVVTTVRELFPSRVESIGQSIW